MAVRTAIRFLCAGLLVAATAPAAPAAPVGAKDPAIAGLEETLCLSKGGPVIVDGANFGSGGGLRLVAIAGPTTFIDFPSRSWSDTKIVATLPDDSRLEPGRIYLVGIALAGVNAVLSNRLTAAVCAAAPEAASSQERDSGFGIGFGIGGIGIGGGGAGGRAPAPVGGGQAPPPAGGQYGQQAPPSQSPTQSPRQPSRSGGTTSGGIGFGFGFPIGPPPGASPAPSAPAAPPALGTDLDYEPGEIVTLFETAAAADTFTPQAAALGYSVKRREDLAGLGLVTIVLQVPSGTPVAAGIAQLRAAFPAVIIDANHRYALQAGEAGRYGLSLIGWRQSTPDCGASLRIGILDTGADTTHPALASRKIESKVFVTMGAGDTPATPDHGTAVAAIIAGDPSSEFRGVLPGAQIFSGAIFKMSGLRGQVATTEAIMRGLSWMAGNKVSIVNMSFAGPQNAALTAVVHASLASHIAIVAAAGNGGPSAPPAYPAAQEGVVAATAVDAATGPYDYANRGSYIAFAAPGVDIWLAAPGGGGKIESGTSFASPFVTAALAQAMAAQPGRSADEAVQKLVASVRDLGPKGRDETFGWGLVQLPNACGAK